jgi:hypothetical protein
MLQDLTGLESLQTVGGNVQFSVNALLVNLAPMNALNSVGGSFAITTSPSLTSIAELSSLTHISGDLMIEYNAQLGSLSGLDNIEPNSIVSLLIENNPNLSECDVQSICDYLAAPNGSVWIYGNAAGCNSQEEILEACLSTVDDSGITGLSFNPNPAGDKITIFSPVITESTLLSVFNANGKKLLESHLRDNESQIDISTLPRGVYFVRVQDEKGVQVAKMIKE